MSVERFDTSRTEDLKLLIENGMIWNGGPRTLQAAVDALVDGDVPLTPDIEARMPADILALVQRKRGEAGA